MKKALSIGFAFLMLMQSFSKVWIFFSFKANQEYIAQNLCVNRYQPEKTCGGKCLLLKEMKEDEGKPQLPKKFKEQKEITCYFKYIDHQEPETAVSASCIKPLPDYLYHQYICYFTNDIFHPPDGLA